MGSSRVFGDDIGRFTAIRFNEAMLLITFECHPELAARHPIAAN